MNAIPASVRSPKIKVDKQILVQCFRKKDELILVSTKENAQRWRDAFDQATEAFVEKYRLTPTFKNPSK